MSQEASAAVAHGGTDTAPPRSDQSRSDLRRFATTGLHWLRSDLFLRTPSGPVGRRKILLAIACVLGGAAVSLSRTVGAGSLNTIWIEDAKNLLDQSLNFSFWTTLKTPISGYYQEPARGITELAIQFPLRWVPPSSTRSMALSPTSPAGRTCAALGSGCSSPRLRARYRSRTRRPTTTW
jgi:hypothetical protein